VTPREATQVQPIGTFIRTNISNLYSNNPFGPLFEQRFRTFIRTKISAGLSVTAGNHLFWSSAFDRVAVLKNVFLWKNFSALLLLIFKIGYIFPQQWSRVGTYIELWPFKVARAFLFEFSDNICSNCDF
jgi:hypothetical protein